MSEVKPFGPNTISTFAYEPFSYTIFNPDVELYTLSLKTTISPTYFTTSVDSVVFETTSNALTVGTQSFTILALDVSGVTAATSVNSVTIGAGRFLDGSGFPFVGSNYVFYSKTAITPIVMVAPFALAQVTSTPTLPPGLSFSPIGGNTVSIQGTPLTTSPQSNYLVIGRQTGSSKTISSTIALVISNERTVSTILPSSSILGMTIGTPIVPTTLTTEASGTIRYAWNPFPDGIIVRDASGNEQTSGFSTSNSPFVMAISGAPTLAAANSFKNSGISSLTRSILVERISPSPVLSNTIAITFTFGETVLFDPTTLPPFYAGIPLDPSANVFRAETYFSLSNVPIASIFSPDLRPDLTLTFDGNSRAYLTGTPLSAGTGTYTIRATNSNGITRDLAATITVSNDSVSFTPAPPIIDTCYNFIISRPLDLALTGYYPAPIQFSAAAASGRTILWSAPGLTGTGLSLSPTSGATTTIIGTPTNIASLQTLAITANATGSPGTATRNVKFAIVNDAFTFATLPTLAWIQNKPISPVRNSATSLSGRPVTSYSSTDLPTGIAISSIGVLSGTPLGDASGTFVITASTGYTSGSQTFSFGMTADSIVLIERPQPSYALTLGGPIPPATVSGLSYSGVGVSNFVFSNLDITYGMTIGANTGVFGGTFTTSLPPDPVIVSNSVPFVVNAFAGDLSASLAVQLNTSNIPTYRWYTLKGARIETGTNDLTTWADAETEPGEIRFTDLLIRPISLTARVIVAVTNKKQVVQSSNGIDFTYVSIPDVPWPFYPEQEGPMEGFVNLGPNVITPGPTSSVIYGTGYEPDYTTTGGFWKSVDNGLTWSVTWPLLATGVEGPSWYPTAVTYGNAIAYKNSVLLIGGIGNPPTIRSVDEGNTWSAVTGGLALYVSSFSVDASRWIAAGSDNYLPGATYSSVSRTLRYSDNQGLTWSLSASGDFNYIADTVIYGNNIWIAGGKQVDVCGSTFFELRSSTDGSTWNSFVLPGTWYRQAPPPIDPDTIRDYLDSINYDGANYNIVITRDNDGSLGQKIFQHLADETSLTTGWQELTTNINTLSGGDPPPDTVSGNYSRRLQGRYPVSTTQPESTLFFPNQTGGPVITSPTSSSLLLFQYVAMTPLVLSATGTDRIYFFIAASEIPDGLAFDSVTNTLSGTPAQTGDATLVFYAKDSVGVTTFALTIRVILASIVRQQTSAGAWTSLVRQYTEVNAAETARDNRALPAIDYRLGEFTSPEPPSVITAASNCLC